MFGRIPPITSCFFIVLFGFIFGAGGAMGAPAAVWLKIETDDFVVYSDAPSKEAVECALRYSAFRKVFNSLFATGASSLPPSTLVIFRTSKSFQTQTNNSPDRISWSNNGSRIHRETINFSAEIDGTPLNAFAWAGDHDVALSSTFEFETIWSLQRLNYAIPLGMSQGAGEVLATLSLAKGKCLVGHYGNNSYNSNITWPQFFRVDGSSSTYHNPKTLGDFLGQSWGLMHWLLLTDGVNGEHFKAIAGKLNHMSALEAIAAEMHVDSAQLNKTITRHLSEAPSRTISFDEVNERTRLIPVPAPEAEVLVQMANLLAANNQFAESNAQLDRARILAPDLPLVKEAYARRMQHEERSDESLRLYREAIAAGSKNVFAYLLSATTRLDDLRMGGGDMAGEGGKPAELAVEELRQALKLNPGNLQALRLLGRALFLKPNITNTDLNELNQGVELEKNGGSVRYYRALIYSRLGLVEESHADLQEIIHNTQLPDGLRRSAKSRYISEIVTANAKRIEGFLNEKNYQAAREFNRKISEHLDDDELRTIYKRFASLIDQQEANDSSKGRP